MHLHNLGGSEDQNQQKDDGYQLHRSAQSVYNLHLNVRRNIPWVGSTSPIHSRSDHDNAPVRIRHSSHHFAIQPGDSVDLAGWQVKNGFQ